MKSTPNQLVNFYIIAETKDIDKVTSKLDIS